MVIFIAEHPTGLAVKTTLFALAIGLQPRQAATDYHWQGQDYEEHEWLLHCLFLPSI